MKLTNVHSLPETIINVIKRPQYTKGGAQLSVLSFSTVQGSYSLNVYIGIALPKMPQIWSGLSSEQLFTIF